jgi:segregation and condensation protein B
MEDSPVERQELKKAIEAIIFYSKKPVTLRRLTTNITEADAETIKSVLDEIMAQTTADHGFTLQDIAGGYMFLSNPAYAAWIERFEAKEPVVKLSNAALETLAIIAFKQPITRAEIEAIRGVGCLPVINGLVEKNLVTIKGRSEELGAPLLYGTTREFLEYFGLGSVNDLPKGEELK